MTDWDIDPEAVSRILQATYDEATKLETFAGNYGSYLQGAAGNAGGMIADALNGFAISYNRSFNAIAAQVVASLTGAKDATIAYLNGQYEMATNAQRAANGVFDRQHQVDQQKAHEDMRKREASRPIPGRDTGGDGTFKKAHHDLSDEPVEPYTGTGGTSTVESGRTPGGAS